MTEDDTFKKLKRPPFEHITIIYTEWDASHGFHSKATWKEYSKLREEIFKQYSWTWQEYKCEFAKLMKRTYDS